MISLVSSVLAMSLLMSPHGQYKTTVRVPMITRQDITIDVKTRTIGCITLKGTINMSEDFVFDYVFGYFVRVGTILWFRGNTP